MSAHILSNLLNKLRKSDKMRGLLSIFSLFRNEFNKFNYIGARMLDSIYHVTIKLSYHHALIRRRKDFAIRDVVTGVIS